MEANLTQCAQVWKAFEIQILKQVTGTKFLDTQLIGLFRLETDDSIGFYPMPDYIRQG